MPPKTTREQRIDWLRGLALVMIFINHMPGNRLEHWTNRNYGFSDAAELFVLLAGVAAAFAYFRRFETGHALDVSWKAIRRAGTLYSAHILSTLAAIVLFAAVAQWTRNPNYLDLIGISPLFSDPMPGLIGIVTVRYHLNYFDILPLYIVLLLALPAYMWLARRSVSLMLGVALALYVTGQIFKFHIPNHPVGGGWFFNPFLWQLIFAIGLAIGIMRMRGQSVPFQPVAYALAIGYLIFAYIWMRYSLGGQITHGVLPRWMDTLHKSYLPPPRLLHVLALGYVLVYSPLWAPLARLAAKDPVLTRLGRNGLPVFVAGSLLSMIGYLTLVTNGQNILLELGLTIAGIAAMWLVALCSEQGVRQTVRSARIGIGLAPDAADHDTPSTVQTRR